METPPIDMDGDIGSPEMPEAGNDPADPLRPEIEEENSIPNPTMAKPTQDMEVIEDKEDMLPDDDNESQLSEVDEAQFEDFDPNNIDIEETAPRDVDLEAIAGIKVARKKDGGERTKRKEKKREKKRKRRRDDDDQLDGGEELDGDRRSRKKRDSGEGRTRAMREDTPEEDLPPEERRKRALERAMDAAIKGPKRSTRKKDGIDLESMADAEIEEMRQRMTQAAQADTDSRQRGQPAMHKLKMLPEVVALLNRNTITNSLVDPDINLLEAVRFFLEPLNDGSLPAYNIQRDLFACLAKLPITKDTLVASGIGKVTLFYTKSNKPEPLIRRQAERLINEWTRPILKRNDDYRKKEIMEVAYNPDALPIRGSQHPSQTKVEAAAAARQRALAMPNLTNRARLEGGLKTYTIAPRSNVTAENAARPIGAAGAEAFRKIKARQIAKTGGTRR